MGHCTLLKHNSTFSMTSRCTGRKIGTASAEFHSSTGVLWHAIPCSLVKFPATTSQQPTPPSGPTPIRSDRAISPLLLCMLWPDPHHSLYVTLSHPDYSHYDLDNGGSRFHHIVHTHKQDNVVSQLTHADLLLSFLVLNP